MENNHTPGKWITAPLSEQEFDFIITDDRLTDEKKLPICAIYASNINEHSKANAAHIVQCVNSHDILVKALKVARKAMLKHGINYDNADVYNVIDKAIKNATNP